MSSKQLPAPDWSDPDVHAIANTSEPAEDSPPIGKVKLSTAVPRMTTIAAHVYACNMFRLFRDTVPFADLTREARAQIAAFEPRDAAEEMLVCQMLMTHARVVHLSWLATAQKNQDWADLMHAAADRAAGTYRRQMETLAQHRKPRRSRRTSITTIRTAHINAKQILTQSQPSDVQSAAAAAETQAPDFSEAPIAVETADQKDQTLAKKHRPKNLPG